MTLDHLLLVLRGGYSLAHLERRTGVARETLARYRDGANSPTFEVADLVMRVVIEDAIALSKMRAQNPSLTERIFGPQVSTAVMVKPRSVDEADGASAFP